LQFQDDSMAFETACRRHGSRTVEKVFLKGGKAGRNFSDLDRVTQGKDFFEYGITGALQYPGGLLDMDNTVRVLLGGFPGKADNAFLGWGAVTLMRFQHSNVSFDTELGVAGSMSAEKLPERGLQIGDTAHVFPDRPYSDHRADTALFPKTTFSASRTERNHVNSDQDIYTSETHPLFSNSYKKDFIRCNLDTFPDTRNIYTPGHTPGCIPLPASSRIGTAGLTGNTLGEREATALSFVAVSKDTGKRTTPDHAYPSGLYGDIVGPLQIYRGTLPDGSSGIDRKTYPFKIRN